MIDSNIFPKEDPLEEPVKVEEEVEMPKKRGRKPKQVEE